MTEDEAKLLHTTERHEFQDNLRRHGTRQGAFEDAMIHYDHPLPGGGWVVMPGDGGAGAEAVRDACLVALDGLPVWQRLWINAYMKLEPKGKTILNALKEEWRSRPAARIAGVDHKTVDRWKTIFKERFDQCHQAFRRYLAG